ncbi:MAG: 3-dehydroquinate dehydratase [Sulfurimonadaceae bacterium]
MRMSRGLTALIFTLLFSTSLFAEYLYKDDVVQRDSFTEEIEEIGSELYEKTGVSLYLVMVRDLDENQTLAAYELELANELKQPAVILSFVELKKQVQILANPSSLYNDFDKEQILSPSATFIGAVISSVMFARSFDDVKEFMSNYGGVILPILAERAKGDDIVNKYAVAMFNGYSEIAEQIAASHDVDLESAAGSGNQIAIDVIRLIFYGVLLLFVFKYLRGKFFGARKKDDDENNNEEQSENK